MPVGLVWSGFRPSDDPSQLAYPIPANMYAAAGLERALELNRQVLLTRYDGALLTALIVCSVCALLFEWLHFCPPADLASA